MSEKTETAGDAVALLRSLGYSVSPPSTVDGVAVRWGCHVELYAMPDDFEPDGCVIDEGLRQNCIYAGNIACKEQCEYWKPFTAESLAKMKQENANART